jgi:hypothetical protein
MQNYLVKLNVNEISAAQADNKVLPERYHVDENLTEHEQNSIDVACDIAARNAAMRLSKIKLWSQVDETDPMDRDEKKKFMRNHMDRLNRYRQHKEWETIVNEDDHDIEGDRLLAEIKNYKEEQFFNTNFYK